MTIREEWDDADYGFNAQRQRMDRHLIELVEAIKTWEHADSPCEISNAAGQLQVIARSINNTSAAIARLTSSAHWGGARDLLVGR